MVATDPLSLVFLGCVVFSGAFLVISMIGGMGHAHVPHAGHVAHVGHAAHVAHAGHVGHAGHVAHAGHAGHAAHAGPAGHEAGAAGGQAAGTPAAAPTPLAAAWAGAGAALLSSLNLFSLLTFLFVFGLFGYALHNATHLGVVLTLLVPIVLGGAGALVVGALLGQLFESDTGVLTAADSRPEGRMGRVSMTIRAGGVGEVIFTRPGAGRQSIGARVADGADVPAGTEVVILNVREGIATVQSWDTFIRGVRAGISPALEPLPPGA